MTTPDDWEAERVGLTTALERMAGVGWLASFAISPDRGIALEWTAKGEEKITAFWKSLQDFDVEDIDKELLWAIRSVAVLQFREVR